MESRAVSRGIWGVIAALFLLVTFWEKPAHAYAWMIRNDYTGCNQCHADPSGGGLLTEYGRAQSDFLLRMRYGAPESYEPPRSAEFLFGLMKLPESVLLGGDVRFARLAQRVNGQDASKIFFMQADLQGQVAVERIKVNGSIGYAEEGARQAALTTALEKNLVSRLHWIGADLGADRNWQLRGGRMNMPFGIRGVEHTMWVRSTTRTDTNSSQQHGVSLAYNGAELRGEVMLIAGNFQVSPDAYRERGYSGYLEYATSQKLAFGASSLVARAEKDVVSQQSLVRHAHGVFGRYTPAKPLVLLAEADLLAEAPEGAATSTGFVGMLQADAQVIQGLHVIGTGEFWKAPTGFGTSAGVWGSLVWFFLPHFDTRLDVIWQTTPTPTTSVDTTTLLAQLHAFL
ncbi:MAG: hypothetical protein ABW133_03030 [Polyangiaceae bacterium]